jgi:hypothetical protein
MSISVKRITLWRTEVANKPGVLSNVLGPLAATGADLQIVMGYHYHGAGDKAAIEVYPVSGKKGKTAAEKGGLSECTIPTLLVEGDNHAGLGSGIATALGEAGINMGFLVAQVIGERFSAVIGLANEEAAKTATSLIKKAAKQLAR